MNRLITVVAGLAVGMSMTIAGAGGAGVAPLGATGAIALHDDEGALYKSIIDKVSPAMVTIKMVLKLEGAGAGGDEAQDAEVTGLMIDTKGMILVSNTMIGGMMKMFTITPTNIKVLFEDDDAGAEGISARLVARDSELDLAWFQIDDEKAKDRVFKPIDLASGAPAAMGDTIYTPRRMDKFFDRVSFISEGRIGGLTTKPRAMVVPTGFQVDPGGPVFGADGKLLGVGAIILPGEEDMDVNNFREIYGRTGPLILPASEVRSATERAREIAAKPVEPKPAEEATPPTPEVEKPAESPKP